MIRWISDKLMNKLKYCRSLKKALKEEIHCKKISAGAPDAYPDLSGNQSGSIWIFVHPQIRLYLDQFPVLSGKNYSFFNR